MIPSRYLARGWNLLPSLTWRINALDLDKNPTASVGSAVGAVFFSTSRSRPKPSSFFSSSPPRSKPNSSAGAAFFFFFFFAVGGGAPDFSMVRARK